MAEKKCDCGVQKYTSGGKCSDWCESLNKEDDSVKENLNVNLLDSKKPNDDDWLDIFNGDDAGPDAMDKLIGTYWLHNLSNFEGKIIMWHGVYFLNKRIALSDNRTGNIRWISLSELKNEWINKPLEELIEVGSWWADEDGKQWCVEDISCISKYGIILLKHEDDEKTAIREGLLSHYTYIEGPND